MWLLIDGSGNWHTDSILGRTSRAAIEEQVRTRRVATIATSETEKMIEIERSGKQQYCSLITIGLLGRKAGTYYDAGE